MRPVFFFLNGMFYSHSSPGSGVILIRQESEIIEYVGEKNNADLGTYHIGILLQLFSHLMRCFEALTLYYQFIGFPVSSHKLGYVTSL